MKFYLFIFLVILSAVCGAQEPKKTAHNSLYLELGKTGLLFNIYYDHEFTNKQFGLRAGAGSNFGKYLNGITAGAGGYWLTGNQPRHLELGIDIHYLVVDEVSDDQIGLTFLYPDYSVSTLYGSINIGYRRYKKNNLFRCGISPGWLDSKFVPGAYLSLGVTF